MFTRFAPVRRAALAVATWVVLAACDPPAPGPAPTITDVSPTRLCVDGGRVVVTGTDFRAGAVVRLTDGATEVSLTPTVDGPTMLSVETGARAAGTYDLSVDNADGTTVTEVDAITIFDEPVIVFVDPPVLWNGLSVQVTIYASGVIGRVQSVEIAPTGTETRQSLPGFVQDTVHPNRIRVDVPAELAAGAYDVWVTDEVCEAVLVGGLEIVAETSVALTAIDPPFGWTGADTAVTITADTSGGPGLVATPRVYFSPASGGLAAPGRAVTFEDASAIGALVPAGLAPGMYDVIVVNPDATVGVLTGDAGFRVTVDAPPTIVQATPGSIDSGTATAITLTGSGFAAGAEVVLSCLDVLGAALPDATVTPSAIATDGTSLTFSSPLLAAGTVCVVRVTNIATDGTYGDFSAISVTNPASNLEPFTSSDAGGTTIRPLTTGRVGLGLVAGRVSATQRYLYAIGGDTGDLAGALDTVEATPIDLFGRMLGWEVQRQGTTERTLGQTRTELGAVRIGQYLYVGGGADDAGTALATVERARILDPLAVPELDDVEVTLDDTSGVGPGGWVYRIAAVTSPDGESLPSEPINITVPVLDDATRHVRIGLTWTEVPGATAYRVYRTRAAGEPASSAAFLAEVDVTSFTDDGATVPAADAPPPLAIGALGEWHVAATLSVGRIGAAVAAARGATDDEWFLYVAGGHDGTTVLDSYELVSVSIDPVDGSQDVGTPAVGTRTIGGARQRLSAWTVDSTTVASAGSDVFVYFGVGENAAGSAEVRATVAGRVDPSTGELLATDAGVLDAISPSSHSGAAAITASGFLYGFGGGPTPVTGGSSAEVCRPGLAGCATTMPPELRSWNSLGSGGVLVPRYLAAAAVESAFVFVAGGTSTGTAALASVERTIR